MESHAESVLRKLVAGAERTKTVGPFASLEAAEGVLLTDEEMAYFIHVIASTVRA